MFFFASIVTSLSSNCHAFPTDALLKLVYVPLVYHGTFLRATHGCSYNTRSFDIYETFV